MAFMFLGILVLNAGGHHHKMGC